MKPNKDPYEGNPLKGVRFYTAGGIFWIVVLMGLSFESYEIWEHGDVAVGIILDSNISCSMPKIEVMGELYIIENCDTYPEGIELPVVSLPKSYDRVYVGEKGESPIAFILNRGSWVYFFWGLILIFIGSMIQFYAKKHFQHQS